MKYANSNLTGLARFSTTTQLRKTFTGTTSSPGLFPKKKWERPWGLSCDRKPLTVFLKKQYLWSEIRVADAYVLLKVTNKSLSKLLCKRR